MMSLRFLSLLVACSLCLGWTAGCHRGAAHDEHDHAGHDHHDHEEESPFDESKVVVPPRYGDAVERIAALSSDMDRLIRAGDLCHAHPTLDELDLVLQRLMPVAQQDNVPRKRWEGINLAARQLRLTLNEIHEALDEHRDPELSKRAGEIDRALSALRSAATVPVEPSTKRQE